LLEVYVGTDDGAAARRGPGQVVPDELRPIKSGTLYAHTEIADKTGRVSPHMLPQPYGPVNGKGGEDLSGPYEVVEGWPDQVEPGWRLSGPSGAVVESPDRVIVVSHFGLVGDRLTPLVWGRNVFAMEGSPYRTYGTLEMRREHFVLTFDRGGRVVDSWTWNDHLFRKINRIFVDPHDPERHIWITDSKKQTIYKFTNDGRRLVMTVGEVAAGSVPENPWKAEDIIWLPNGDFYTAGLGRIDRFNRSGELQWSRMTRGSEPGEFLDLHGMCHDTERGRIYIADRGNSRIQVFDEDWNVLDVWPHIYAPYAMRLEEGGDIWIADGFTSKFLRYSPDGHLVTSWGTFGIAPGTLWGVHWFETDEEGSLYICEVYGERMQKFRPRADVAPDDPRLIGTLRRY
jgi:peptidylamidoglycolate lyase